MAYPEITYNKIAIMMLIYIIDVNNMEAVLRIVINTRSLEESTAEFRLGLKGLLYQNGVTEDWSQGSYNLSSSLTVIQMDYR